MIKKVLILMTALIAMYAIFESSASDANLQDNVDNVEARQKEKIDINQSVVRVSIINLIATPEKYDQKRIRTIGYVQLEFEGNAIYLHHDFDKFAMNKNAISLQINNDILGKSDQYHGKYVIIEGIFDAKDKGHRDSYSGSIISINRFQVWADKDKGFEYKKPSQK